jgi:putative transposase
MKEKSTEGVAASSPTWETLETFARQSMQQLLQRMLEEEVDGVLGRARYERHGPVDAVVGYRNGFGKPRRLSLSNGTITLRRPRVRGLSERFESRLLPAFKRRTEEVGRLLPELYLHGLAQGDFDLALRGLLGDGVLVDMSKRGNLDRRRCQLSDAGRGGLRLASATRRR